MIPDDDQNEGDIFSQQYIAEYLDFLNGLAKLMLLREHPQTRTPAGVVRETLGLAKSRWHLYQGRSRSDFAIWLREILVDVMGTNASVASNEQSIELESLLAPKTHRSTHSSDTSWRSLIEEMQPSSTSTEEQVELRFLIAEAITRLPESEQEAVILKFLGGLKLSQVASALGRSKVATASLLRIGIQTLRRSIDRTIDVSTE